MSSTSTPAEAKRKKILMTVAGIAGVIAIYFVVDHFLYVSTDNAQVDGHFVMLAAKVGGYVKEVKVVEGQKVKQGDILAEIDARDYDNTLRQASGTLTSIEAKKNDAEKSFKRISTLFAKGVVAQQQYDSASAGYSEAKANYEAASAQVSQAQLNLENTKIRAPTDGFIAKKSVEVGQLATPGVPLIGFVDSQERWVTANFKETEISRIRMGASVKVKIDAIEEKTYHGKVVSVSSATGSTFTLLPPDNASGNFTKVVQRVPVKIQLEGLNSEDFEKLRIGLSVDARVSIR
ncbi:MAG: HlyD family secretion protein [Bdellovibrionales bacterium]